MRFVFAAVLVILGVAAVSSIPDRIQFDLKGNYPPEWRFIQHPIANPMKFDIAFWLKSAGDCYVRLAPTPYVDDLYFYGFYLGFLGNTFVCIYRGEEQVVDTTHINLLNANSFVDFHLTFDGKTLTLSKGSKVLASYKDPEPFKFRYFGVTSYVEGKNNPSWWKIEGEAFADELYCSAYTPDGHCCDQFKELTASSEYDPSHGVYRSGLFTNDLGGSAAWCTKTNDGHQWIQADLGAPQRTTGILLQGRGVGCCDQWVTSFRVLFSNDTETFYSTPTMEGTYDRHTIARRYFDCPIYARYVRLVPISWYGHISLRFDLIGCDE